MSSNQDILLKLAVLLKKHRVELAQRNSDDVNTCLQTNLDNVDRGIATLQSYAAMEPLKQATGGIAIYSCYNDPTFGVFGMTLAPAVLAGGAHLEIVIAYPSILKSYAHFVRRILNESKLLSNCKVVVGSTGFFNSMAQNTSIRHAVVFGDEWIEKYLRQFKEKGVSLTYYGPGNNAAIILPGADIKKAAKKILDSAFILSGQAAICINRCFIDDRIDKQLIKEAFDEQVKGISVGNDIQNFVTPIIIPSLVQNIKNRIEKIKSDERLSVLQTNNGWLIYPAIVYPETINAELINEYHFAPILPVIFSNYNAIATLIKNADFGLYTSVYGELDLISGLESELSQQHVMVLKNQSILDVLDRESGYAGPWGGYKKSGFYMGPSTSWTPKGGAYKILETITE